MGKIFRYDDILSEHDKENIIEDNKEDTTYQNKLQHFFIICFIFFILQTSRLLFEA